MSKFCSKCGGEMSDEARFCPVCGTSADSQEQVEPAAPVNEAPIAPETAEAAAPAEPTTPETTNAVSNFLTKLVDKVQDFSQKATVYVRDYIAKAKGNPKMWIAPGAIGAGIIALIVLLVVLLFGNKYTSALDTYIDVRYYGKVQKLGQLAPAEYWDYYEDENDISLEDLKEQYEDTQDVLMDFMEELYGKNIRITYKIIDEKELSDRKLEKIADALDDQYEMDVKVTEGYKVELELTIKGSEDDDKYERTWYFLKIGGRWYATNCNEYGGEYSVSFLPD